MRLPAGICYAALSHFHTKAFCKGVGELLFWTKMLHWQSSWAWSQGSQPCVSFFISSFKIALVVITTSVGRLACSCGVAHICTVSTNFPTPPSVRHSSFFHFTFLGVLQYSNFLSECVPHLESSFLLCKRKQSDSSTLYKHTCGITAHNSMMLLNCMRTCTGMIPSLEWLISYTNVIIVAGILNLYLDFCQRWSLALFKLSSLLLFFLKQHSSWEESSQGWCCLAFSSLNRCAGCLARVQYPISHGQKKFHIPVQRLPSSCCLPVEGITEAWGRGRKKLTP